MAKVMVVAREVEEIIYILDGPLDNFPRREHLRLCITIRDTLFKAVAELNHADAVKGRQVEHLRYAFSQLLNLNVQLRYSLHKRHISPKFHARVEGLINKSINDIDIIIKQSAARSLKNRSS